MNLFKTIAIYGEEGDNLDIGVKIWEGEHYFSFHTDGMPFPAECQLTDELRKRIIDLLSIDLCGIKELK